MDKSSLEELHGELMQIIRNNYYPICPRPDLVLGLSPHSDSNSITILLQDEVTGLQIRHDGGWVPITPMPNALLVNIGDCIEVLCLCHSLSNGIFSHSLFAKEVRFQKKITIFQVLGQTTKLIQVG